MAFMSNGMQEEGGRLKEVPVVGYICTTYANELRAGAVAGAAASLEAAN